MGDGGDQDAREDMFVTQVPSYQDNPFIGQSPDPKKGAFNPSHPLYQAIKDLIHIRTSERLLRHGALIPHSQTEVLSFSRVDPDTKEELVVFLNPHPHALTTKVETVWPRHNLAALFPEPSDPFKDQEIELNPFEVKIFKGGPMKEARLSKSSAFIVSPKPLEPVSGWFAMEVRVEGAGLHRVEFFRKKSESDWISLGEDLSPPYLGFTQATGAEGEEITLKAKITSEGFEPIWLERTFVTDHRSPEVWFKLKDLPQDAWVGVSYQSGKTIPLGRLNDQTLKLQWPKEEQSLLILVETKDQKVYYPAKVVDYERDVRPELKGRGKEAPFAELNLAFSSFALLEPSEKSSSFGGRELFVRGDMNGWGLSDPLMEKDAFSHEAIIALKKGTYSFKLADKDWTSAYNFGAPLSSLGLLRSEANKNLLLTIEETGEYIFKLVTIPKNLAPDGKPRAHLRVRRVHQEKM